MNKKEQPGYHSSNVEVGELQVDLRYQTSPPKPAEVRRMATDWDERAVGTIIVSMRHDGTLWVIDGQRRVAAARLKFGPHRHLPAIVHTGLSLPEEARLFDLLDNRRRHPPLEKFQGQVMAGDPRAVGVNNIVCIEFGLEIGRGGGKQSAANRRIVRSVTDLMKVYHSGGPDMLRRCLRLLWTGFANDPNQPLIGNAISGMGAFLTRYPEANDRRIVEVLSRTGVARMQSLSRQMQAVFIGMSPAAAWGRSMLEVYNLALRTNRLPEWVERVQTLATATSGATRRPYFKSEHEE